MKPIPPEWIKNHVDTLLEFAGKLDESSPLRNAVMTRADHIMDLVRAWKDISLDNERKEPIEKQNQDYRKHSDDI
jgi:hypothetical protein